MGMQAVIADFIFIHAHISPQSLITETD